MGKITGFKEFERKVPSYLPPEERTKNYKEFVVQLPPEDVQTQGARCMDCGIPFCHTGCPLGNIIPDFNDHVYNGKWEAALKSLLSTNNFPEFTGRICPAPCESACVLGINKPPVTIKNIEVSIIDYAYAQGFIKPNPPPFRTGKKVAVVGSGPAGLAAADQLNKAGHLVTVFERSDRLGGLMRYGIPDFKLGKDVVQRRIDLMVAEGVTFRTKAEVGVNVPVSELKEGFDAIVLAGGSTLARDLPIPGRDAKGVYLAMDFLRQNNKRVAGDKFSPEEEILSTGKNVVVIGGGDTGSDCVGTSIRHGAKTVTQIELLPKPPAGRTVETPWPTHPGPRMLSTSSSQAEGCERDWSVLSKEFLKDAEGNLTGIRAVRLQWDGPKFTEIEGSEFIMPAERVYLAMGFLHPEHNLPDQLGVAKDERGNVKAGSDYQTSVPGIFSAGDMRRGQSLVVWAISEGRECARFVDEYLTGQPTRLESKNHTMAEATV
ncbi:MAG: glutamate synthase small chain [Fibrobacteria bacterium]|jgi:glutamate synthase (NADPH/NADH) small chain|nr:glutamate synthase small chain [Fibrobacteria bacterium]